MRQVPRIEDAPGVLGTETAQIAQASVEAFLRRTAEERSSRRAPVDEGLYRNPEVLSRLRGLFCDKCAYCERPIEVSPTSEFDAIDHHRPPQNAGDGDRTYPHHYAWLAYKWENLLLVCRWCRSRKRHLFPVSKGRAKMLASFDEIRAREAPDLLDPCYDEPWRHLDFDLTGLCHRRTRRGTAMISILELNLPELVESRAAAFRTLALAVNQAKTARDILALMENVDDTARPFLGALLILRNRYAMEVARLRGLNTFSFADTEGMLDYLHSDADVEVLKRAFEVLHQPRGKAEAAAKAEAPAALPRSDTTPAIRKVVIENFKAIESLVFELPERQPGGDNAACLMLLGENATGKSSILEAIAMTISGVDAIRAMGLKPGDYLRQPPPGPKGVARKREATRIRIDFYDGPSAELAISATQPRFAGTPGPSGNVLAYGSRRFFVTQRRARSAPGSEIRGLFDPMWTVQHPRDWLVGLDKVQFAAVAKALREVLSLKDQDEIVADEARGVMVGAHGDLVPIARLSDGYRSLFATAVDIMRGVLGKDAQLEGARGVVLIDEIETHLHPRWKMRVMSALRKALPQVQFITTTHDPLCLRGLSKGEVEVMQRDADHRIERRLDLPDVKGMRAEQLLISDFFGLDSTADPEMEADLARLTDALQTGAPEAAALQASVSKTMVLGDTPREQIVAEAMDSYLASRRTASAADLVTSRKAAVLAFLDLIEAGAGPAEA